MTYANDFKLFLEVPRDVFWILVKIWEPQGPPHGAPGPPSRGLPLKIHSGAPAYLLRLISKPFLDRWGAGGSMGGPWGSQIFTKIQKHLCAPLGLV